MADQIKDLSRWKNFSSQALGIVGIIHWLLVGHVNIGSDTNKVILSLEVVAFEVVPAVVATWE